MKFATIEGRSGGRPAVLVNGDELLDLRVGLPALSLSRWRPDSVVNIIREGEEGSSGSPRWSWP